MSFFTGSPERHQRVPTFLPEQQGLYNQMQQALQGRGAGGAFGQAADYYRNLLGDNSQDFQAFAAPEQRRFREEILPDIAEQFAGMGFGGLSSSGFRNAAVNAGANLGERLAALRAQLRQQGVQGLTGLGQFGLGNFSQDVMTQPGTEGLFAQLAPAIGGAIGAFGGPIGTAAGTYLGSKFGKSSPYGNNAQGVQ